MLGKCLLSVLTVSAAAFQFGVDLSVETTEADWMCLRTTSNVTYGLVRVYRSKGELDSNAPNSINAAFAAGVRDMHAYVFPCITTSAYSLENAITCSSPADQMRDSVNFLESSGVAVRRNGQSVRSESPTVQRIWLDVEDEDPSRYYDIDVSVNQAAIADMVAAAAAENVSVGIYTTKTYWTKIMGGIEGYSEYPLWYPRYDGTNSMDFFEPFAGWEKVYIKQTAGDAGLCGISQVDTDYMELI